MASSPSPTPLSSTSALLDRERRAGFPSLRGARLAGSLPLPGEWINQALREGKPETDDSPVKGIALAVQDAARATLLVSLDKWPLPKIVEIPFLWDPVLDLSAPGGPILRLTHEAGGLLGAAIPVIVSSLKQPAVRSEGRHITVAIGEILRKKGLGDLVSLLTRLEMRGTPGALTLIFALSIPEQTT